MPVKRLFLSVGAMKAGTTFLYNALNSHPDIYFTPEKELHFFAHVDGLLPRLRTPLVDNLVGKVKTGIYTPRDILSNEFRRHRLSTVMSNRFAKLQNADQLREIVQWYSDRYLCDPVDDKWFDNVFEAAGDRYAAEFSNYNALLSDKGWAHAKSLCDELKVTFVLRHPVERLWSHIKFQYIQSDRRNELNAFGVTELNNFLRYNTISSHARYGDIIESMKKNLNEDQIRILFFEDFTSNFMPAMREIESFLGLSEYHYNHVNSEQKSNATEDIEMPEGIRSLLVTTLKPQLEKIESLGVELPRSYWN